MLNGHKKPGLGYVKYMDNRTTLAVLPPWTVSFHSTREEGALTEVRVMGHVAGLVDGQGNRQGSRSPRWDFDPKCAYPKGMKHAAKVAIGLGLHAFAEANPGRVPDHGFRRACSRGMLR
eukprot:797343-Prymnesium_polylepis.1